MDWHKYQKLLYWKDFVMNCFCFQIFCDHLIVMRYFVMGDHVMAINVPKNLPHRDMGYVLCEQSAPYEAVSDSASQGTWCISSVSHPLVTADD